MNQEQSLNFSLRTDVIIRRVFWCFLGIELLIVFLDVFVNHYEWSSIGAIRRMVNITREDSLSNWFSSLQTIMVGSILWFLWKELVPRKLWYWFLAAISLFAIAVGLDFVEGFDSEFYEDIGIAGFFSTEDYRIRHMSKTLEEFLEMFGTTILLIVFLKNLFRLSQEWKIDIVQKS